MKNEIHCILKNPVCVSAVECPNCGWNAEVHARRVAYIRSGHLTKRKDGLETLVVKKTRAAR